MNIYSEFLDSMDDMAIHNPDGYGPSDSGAHFGGYCGPEGPDPKSTVCCEHPGPFVNVENRHNKKIWVCAVCDKEYFWYGPADPIIS